MGKATVYCEKCGEMISEEDFSKGKAVHFESKDYCDRCKAEIAHLLPQPVPGGASKRASGVMPSVKRASGILPAVSAASGHEGRPGSGFHKATPAPRAKPGSPAAGRSAGNAGGGAANRGRHEDSRSYRRSEGLSRNAILSLLGALAVLLVIGIFGLMSYLKGRAEQEEFNKRERGARDCVQKADLHWAQNPEDFAGSLSMIGIAKQATDLMTEAAKGRSIDQNFFGRLATLELEVKKKQDLYRRREEKRTKVKELEARGRKSPASIPGLRTELEKLKTECEPLGEELVKLIGTTSQALQVVYVEDAITQLEKESSNLGELTTIAPLKTRYAELLAQCEGLDESLPKRIHTSTQILTDEWNRLAQQVYDTILADVERMLASKLFDDAERRTKEFPRKYEETRYYPDLLKLQSRIAKGREQERREQEQRDRDRRQGDPGGGGGGGRPEVDPAWDKPGAVVSLHSGDDLAGWAVIGFNKQPNSVTWDVPTAGELHGVNSSQNGGIAFKGSPRWQDYELEFDVKCTKGDFLAGVLISETGACVVKCEATMPRDQYRHFRISVVGDNVIIFRPDRTGGIRVSDPRESTKKGVVGFGLEPGSEASFRNIQVKVLKLVE
ncbi:MAG: hypothetical protein HZA54_02585 [Planctomycetes bacterium]|nr:hypothetical protein [Planctomycetota bacterium]